MMKSKKYVKHAVIPIALMIIFGMCPASAFSIPYQSYTYNDEGEPVESPSGYEPTGIINGEYLNITDFNEPADLFVSQGGNVYILDSGNDRVVVMNSQFEFVKTIDSFHSPEGNYRLNGAQGIYVDNDDNLYIADTDNQRVIQCDMNGNIRKTFSKPQSGLYPQDQDFLPKKMVVDKSGVLYVLCSGISKGAVMFSPEAVFMGYYGSNEGDINLQLLIDRFFNSFLSDTQKEKISNYVPVEYSNLMIDSENFIYTCTANSQNSANMIRKLNPLGVNILEAKVADSFQKGFGDLNIYYDGNVSVSTAFVDLCTDENGYISCLDFTRGRIFQYDQDGNLIFVFGGIGNQMGMFKYPVSIVTANEQLLVLDKSIGITVFSLTEFGNQIHNAMNEYRQGYYQESITPWKQVLKYDSNFNLAYIGIGKALMETGEYKSAMGYFKTGHYSEGYDEAYGEYRKISSKENFIYIFTIIVLLLTLYFLSNIPIVHHQYKTVFQKVKTSVASQLRRRKHRDRI